METASKRVTLTIDGKTVEAEAGTTVIQAALDAGVFVPHYCYHQDLSIAGVCRMCLVEIEKNPRLQIACNTPVAEGMVVRSASEKARAAQKGSLELHLINHPLDCPICDKAGECGLQDFYRDIGLYKSRMEFEAKVHKPKAVDIGTIVLDAERCILCTRCVRFTDEVTKSHELAIFNRGDRSELKTYDGGPLRNDYTGNLADICPVGALTAKDFRFQQRVWFLTKTKSVCTFCARGCNTKVSYNPKTKTLYRVEPRRNPEVNRSWICDTGRWDYHYVYDETRLQLPRVRIDGAWQETTWDYCFKTLKRQCEAGGVLVVLSSQMTNEEVLDAIAGLSKLGVGQFAAGQDDSVVGQKEPFDGVLHHRDASPNAAGLPRMAKIGGVTLAKVADAIAQKGVSAIWWLGFEGRRHDWIAPFISRVPKETSQVFHVTSEAPYLESASLILPNVSAFEKSGSVVSVFGRLQRVAEAIPRVGTARDVHALVHGVARGNDRESPPKDRVSVLFEKAVAPALLGKELALGKLSDKGVAVAEGAR